MSVCDHIVVLDFGRQIAEGTPRGGAHATRRRSPPTSARHEDESVDAWSRHRWPEVSDDAPTASEADGLAIEARGHRRRATGPQPVIHDLDLSRPPRRGGRPCSAPTAPARRPRCSSLGRRAAACCAARSLIDGDVDEGAAVQAGPAGADVRHRGEVGVHGSRRRATTCASPASIERRHSRLFPELERPPDVRGGLLSGGEQQMLTLARALSRKPRVLLADELSMGLAPLIVKRLLEAVRRGAEAAGHCGPARRAARAQGARVLPTGPTSCAAAGSSCRGTAGELRGQARRDRGPVPLVAHLIWTSTALPHRCWRGLTSRYGDDALGVAVEPSGAGAAHESKGASAHEDEGRCPVGAATPTGAWRRSSSIRPRPVRCSSNSSAPGSATPTSTCSRAIWRCRRRPRTRWACSSSR